MVSDTLVHTHLDLFSLSACMVRQNMFMVIEQVVHLMVDQRQGEQSRKQPGTRYTGERHAPVTYFL